MQKEHRFFEDIAKMASSAGGTLLQMKQEMESLVRHQVEKMFRHMDVVTREEHDVVKEASLKNRSDYEALLHRVQQLEAQVKDLHGEMAGGTSVKASQKPKPEL